MQTAALLWKAISATSVGTVKNDVEIADRQQVGLACGEPLTCCRPLTLGAVPIPATVVRDAVVAAVLAAFDMAAERRRSAKSRDRRHHLELGQGSRGRHAPRARLVHEHEGDIGGDLVRRSQRG